MPSGEAARREAAARRQAEELRRAEAASPYSVGEEVVRRDGGSASGIGWKRGFVTQLVPGDRLDGSVVRVTASQTDPSARGFEWQEVMKSQLFFEKRPRKEWSTVEFPWGVVTRHGAALFGLHMCVHMLSSQSQASGCAHGLCLPSAARLCAVYTSSCGTLVCHA